MKLPEVCVKFQCSAGVLALSNKRHEIKIVTYSFLGFWSSFKFSFTRPYKLIEVMHNQRFIWLYPLLSVAYPCGFAWRFAPFQLRALFLLVVVKLTLNGLCWQVFGSGREKRWCLGGLAPSRCWFWVQQQITVINVSSLTAVVHSLKRNVTTLVKGPQNRWFLVYIRIPTPQMVVSFQTRR